MYPFNHYTEVCKIDPSDCTHIGEILISSIIAEQEARQLIVVQGGRISASVYLYVCMFVYLCVCNARECKKYARTYVLMKRTSSLQYQDLNCYLDLVVQNDYGFRGCKMNILTRL